MRFLRTFADALYKNFALLLLHVVWKLNEIYNGLIGPDRFALKLSFLIFESERFQAFNRRK